MKKTRLLAFSSSRVGNGGYFETAIPVIEKFLGNDALQIAFVPFAAVTISYEEYAANVAKALSLLPYTILTATPDNAKEIIEKADVVMVGGGNTFKLLHDLYAYSLVEVIKNKVNFGTPFIGWSAGSNVAGESICTSNDMPIIYPASFTALGFLPFQINPHYYNQPIIGFNGETRDQRLSEFLQLNNTKQVVALPEGTCLIVENDRLQLIGSANALLFRWENNAMIKTELNRDQDLSFLL